MLRGAKQFIAKAAARRAVPLILFSIAGKAFAMKAPDVGGVEPWPVSMPIPSTTPYLGELVRRGRGVYAVYDLAGLWSLTVDERQSLCMMVKWGAAEVAVRVDSQIPSLEIADIDMIRAVSNSQAGLIGHWTHQGQDIPVVSLVNLEEHRRQAA